MKKVTVSAPGKLHLAGEHAVVYGKPALVVATSLRLFVALEQTGKGASVSQYRMTDPYIGAIVAAFEKKHSVSVPGDLRVTINSSIPVGSGMGSSAALAVALAGAMSVWHGFPWNAQVINDVAYQAEKAKHANSSGSDPAIATHGGILWYRKELEFLKTLWLLPFKVPSAFSPFILINTGRTESTGALVSFVAEQKKKHEAKFTSLFHDTENVTKQAALCIHDEDKQGFCDAMHQNEILLERMGVVSDTVKRLIRDIEASGGAAKISGAGGKKTGSGVVIAVSDTPEHIIKIAQSYNYPSFQTVLGGEGVKLEQVRT